MKTQGRKVQLAKNEDEIQTSNSEMTENEESEEELQDELESDLELEQSNDELEDSDSEVKVFLFLLFHPKVPDHVKKRKANLVKSYGRQDYSVQNLNCYFGTWLHFAILYSFFVALDIKFVTKRSAYI